MQEIHISEEEIDLMRKGSPVIIDVLGSLWIIQKAERVERAKE